MRTLILGIAGAAMVAVAAGAIFLFAQDRLAEPEAPRPDAVVEVSGAEIGGPFTLTTHEGERVTAEGLIDGPTLVYFGYTFCPDVCPIDAVVMADATRILAERGIDVTPVFVTVDPERDTAEALGGFVEAMHPEMVGLTGAPEEIKAAADAYKVFYSRVEQPDSAIGYLMNHTSFTYFMTAPEEIGALFRHGASAEVIADEVSRVMGAAG